MRPFFLFALLLPACEQQEKTLPLTCEAAVSEAVSTVIDVSWTAPEGGTSYVEFGEGNSFDLRTPDASGTEVSFELLGVPANTAVRWRGVTETPDGSYTCEGSIETGRLPGDFPEVEVTTDDAGQDDAPFILGAFFQGTGAGATTRLVAYRRDGEVVWYFEGPENTTALDVHYDVMGRGLWYNQLDEGMGDEASWLKLITMKGEVLVEHPAPTLHHMFCQFPDGTLAYQGLDVREYTLPETGETDDWYGDTIVEIAPDGTATTVFSTWDHMTPRPNDRMDDGGIYDGADWTHGNMLGCYGDGEEYLLSLGHANDILIIDRASSTITSFWGEDGVPAQPAFSYQHGVNRLDNGNILMFESTSEGAGAIEYEQMDGALVETWRGPFGRKPFALGQAFRLENGNTWVNGGAGGTLYEVQPDGTVVWKMEGRGGTIFGQFMVLDTLYPPQ
jgi:hypothetical protein